jgi:uncharacterized protein involved in type VI secretion and phage assembly
MIFYRGVVEDNNDNMQMGRVKVRIFGLHTPVNNYSSDVEDSLSVEHLPWAEVMGTTSFGLVSGVGISTVLRQGTWVWVVLQQDDPDTPIVIGTISGINQQQDSYLSGVGFTDPDGEYPRTDYIGASDFNALTQGTDYLTTSVIETPSGHQIILDDTSGKESITINHKSGSYIKFDSTGNIVIVPALNLYLNTPNGQVFTNSSLPS